MNRRVNIITDRTNWSLDWDAYYLKKTLEHLGYKVKKNGLSFNKIVYFVSKYKVLKYINFFSLLKNKIVFDYYHGDPRKSSENHLFLNEIKKNQDKFTMIRVSNSIMENILKNEGLDQKIFKIPIGINIKNFLPQTKESKIRLRKKFDLPFSAIIIGSFQKDGQGWEEGNNPKLEKGPDIFLKTVEELKKKIPELFILLTGPSRGYVINGLEKLGIKYKHFYIKNYLTISEYYQCLDAYLISSRDEGGPKALLESFASGVPVVSTKVGQAADLIVNGQNGFLSDKDDVFSLSDNLHYIINNSEDRNKITKNGLKTANNNSYDSQLKLWSIFFDKINIS